jgi:hypothetical protein
LSDWYDPFPDRYKPKPWQRESTGHPAESLDNPYWKALEDKVEIGGLSLCRAPTVGEWRRGIEWDDLPARHEFTKKYSWTITDPDSIAFVAHYAGSRVVDPMAGTGYWAYLLTQLGIDVVCYDRAPGGNDWHGDAPLHAEIMAMEGRESVKRHKQRTLLLSWPPYSNPSGNHILRAYRGHRVIYIGESEGGCCGDDWFHRRLDKHWVEVDEHIPVQWFGLHDRIIIYDRRTHGR